MEAKLFFSIIIAGATTTLSVAQSGNNGTDNGSDDGSNIFQDEAGITIIALAGFILLVLGTLWLWFCCKIYKVNKEARTVIRSNDRQYNQRLAQIRLQRARQLEIRNTRRAIENSLNESRQIDETSIDGRSSTELIEGNNEIVDDEMFFGNLHVPTRSKTKPSNTTTATGTVEEPPPSFDSIIPFNEQSPSYTTSSHPPFTQQQRILNTFQHLPEIVVSDIDSESENQQQRPTASRRIESNNSGRRYDEASRRDNRLQESQGQGIEETDDDDDGILDFMPAPQANNHFNGLQSEASTSGSSDDSSEDEDDDHDSSSSSINIDELISEHLKTTNIPKIGMVTCDNQPVKIRQPQLPFQIQSSPQYFQRFDQRTRIPIHPGMGKNLHPLSLSHTYNSEQ